MLEAVLKLRVTMREMHIRELPVITLSTEDGMRFESAMLSSNDFRLTHRQSPVPKLDPDGYLSITIDGIKVQWMPPMHAQARIDKGVTRHWFPTRG